jgi:hypothetical protein
MQYNFYIDTTIERPQCHFILVRVTIEILANVQNDIKNFRYTRYTTSNIWIVTIAYTNFGHSYWIAQNMVC